MRARYSSSWRPWIAAFLVASSGCDMPRDPEGTFRRVAGGTVRVGITEQKPWTWFENGQPRGIEVELIERFTRQIDARIEWTRDSETKLLETLQGGSLDVVIGGLKDSTPWSSHVALTRPYLALQGEKHVLAVQQGENRWLLELDKFLQSHRGEALELYRQAEK